MYEHRHQKVIPVAHFAHRLARHILAAIVLLIPALLIGTVGFHLTEGLGWLDSFMQSSMLLSGMGPTDFPKQTAGKLFASFYALFSGLVLLTAAAVIMAPFAHRVLHHFHAEK